MVNAYKHAENSAKRFGGNAEDYLEIHDLLDSSEVAWSDSRHRVLTHNAWFVKVILLRLFGPTIETSGGEKISVEDIAEWHIREDFGGSYPSVSDYLASMKYQRWMDDGKRGAIPPSHEGLPDFDADLLDPEIFRRRKKGALRAFPEEALLTVNLPQ